MLRLVSLGRATVRKLHHPSSDYLILAAVVLVIAIANFIWVQSESRPPHWDMARHLWNSLLYYDDLRDGRVLPFIQAYHYYPPLLYWLTAPLYLLLGTGIPITVMVNTLFVATLTFSVYEIGKLLSGRLSGLTAVGFVLSYPIVVTQFKEFQLDAPLAAICALALLLLIQSREFSRLWPTLFFGLVFGLGMLTKWTFMLMLILPVIVAIVHATIMACKERQWQRLRHLAVAGLIAYAVSSVWYLPNIQQLRIDTLVNGGTTQAMLEGDPPVHSVASATWYLNNLLNQQIYLIPFLVFLMSLMFLLWKRKLVIKYRYPLLLFAGTYVMFSLISNKDPRYTMAFLPVVALVSTWWVSRLNQRWGHITAAFIALSCMLVFLSISFGIRLLPATVSFAIGDYPVTVFAQKGYIIGPPTRESWYQKEAVVISTKQPVGQRSILYSGPESIWLNNWGWTYYCQKYGVTQAKSLEDAGVAVVRDEAISPPVGFKSIQEHLLPDGSKLTIYVRSPP